MRPARSDEVPDVKQEESVCSNMDVPLFDKYIRYQKNDEN